MATNDFSIEGLKSIIHYDRKTGVIRRIFNHGTCVPCDVVLGKESKQGYIKVSVFGKLYGAHRIAWFYVRGRWPVGDIDHIDGNKANNAFSNLREVSHCVNIQNQVKARKGSSSGFLGVSAAPFNKWVARIAVDGKNKYLGHYTTPEDAHEAYLNAKRKMHKGCTI